MDVSFVGLGGGSFFFAFGAIAVATTVVRNLHAVNGATLVCSASFFTVNEQGVRLITF
jgi:hypothetical protein